MIDTHTGKALDTYVDTLNKREIENDDNSDLDDDEIMAMLEDDVPDGYRAQRMQQLSTEMDQARRHLDLKDKGFGKATKVAEKEIFEISTGLSDDAAERVIVHFNKPDFKRCQIMTEKLEKMAKKHVKTRFLEIEGAEAPFLVTKLNIKVLPCVIGYLKGKEVMRLVGFEQLGNSDNFQDEALQFQLYNAGLVDRLDSSGFEKKESEIFGFKKGIRGGLDDESDDDY